MKNNKRKNITHAYIYCTHPHTHTHTYIHTHTTYKHNCIFSDIQYILPFNAVETCVI